MPDLRGVMRGGGYRLHLFGLITHQIQNRPKATINGTSNARTNTAAMMVFTMLFTRMRFGLNFCQLIGIVQNLLFYSFRGVQVLEIVVKKLEYLKAGMTCFERCPKLSRRDGSHHPDRMVYKRSERIKINFQWGVLPWGKVSLEIFKPTESPAKYQKRYHERFFHFSLAWGKNPIYFLSVQSDRKNNAMRLPFDSVIPKLAKSQSSLVVMFFLSMTGIAP